MIKGKKNQIEYQMEEEWHTQREKNNKTQEEKPTKTAWKPVPAPNKPASEQFNKPTH